MFQVVPRSGRGLLILTAAMVIAASGCGSSTATASPSAFASQSSQPSASASPTDGSAGLDGAASALANLTSYKFRLTVVGGDLSDTLSSLPNAPTDGVFKISGTYIMLPDKAADITVAGALQEISLAGNDYQDNGMTGSFTQMDTGATTLVDQVSPAAVYASFDFTTGFDLVASQPTDPIGTDHYHAGDAAVAQFAAIAGVADANWTADVWIAQNGGYPARISIVATASATDKTIVYERTFDVTDVNAATNKVTAPTNVTGA